MENNNGNIDPHAEKLVAERAKIMLESSLRRYISSFNDNKRTNHNKAHRDSRKKPLRDFKVLARTKIGSIQLSDEKRLKTYFNALVLEMGKHGFIHNHGVDIIRESHGVKRLVPRPTEYKRKHHQMESDQTRFIDKAIEQSGVVEYVAQEIGAIRGYQVLQELINRMADNVNKENSTGGRRKDREY